jgi:lipopolysaccharide transport system permease protein
MIGSPAATTVYMRRGQRGRPFRLWGAMIADLVASRGLAWQLTVRTISAQYRQSYLGYLWAFIVPVANTLVWMLLRGTGVVKLADTGIPYPVYVFTGAMAWQLLMESIQSPLQMIAKSKSFLTKLNFRREALVLSSVLNLLFNMGIKLVVLVLAVFLLGVEPGWRLVLAPAALLVIIVFGVSIGLLLSPLGVLWTDVGRAIPLLGQFAMYLTPVVFTMPTAGTVAKLFALNPATPLVLTARAWLTGGAWEMPGYFLLMAVVGPLLLLMGLMLFRLTLPVLIERMSA